MASWIKRTTVRSGKGGRNKWTKSVNLSTGKTTNSWSQKMHSGRRTVTEMPDGRTKVTVTERNGLGTRRTTSIFGAQKPGRKPRTKRPKKMTAKEKKFWWFVIKWSFIAWCIISAYEKFFR